MPSEREITQLTLGNNDHVIASVTSVTHPYQHDGNVDAEDRGERNDVDTLDT